MAWVVWVLWVARVRGFAGDVAPILARAYNLKSYPLLAANIFFDIDILVQLNEI